MILIPQRLFTSPDVRTLLRDGNNCILHKSLSTEVIGREAYVSNHVVSIVIAGEQRLRTYDETVIRVRAGELVFLPRGVYYVTDLKPKEGNFQSLLFYFDDDIIQQYLKDVAVGEIDRAAAPEYLRFPQSAALKTFATALLSVFGVRPFGKPFLGLKTLELLHLINANTTDAAFSQFLFRLTLPKQRNIRQFMEHNYDKPLKVEDYAYLTGRSPTTFRRDFKAYFDTTPQRWIKDRRIARAVELARAGGVSVGELAHAVGYDNTSYFIREFRERMGASPKQFMLGLRGDWEV